MRIDGEERPGAGADGAPVEAEAAGAGADGASVEAEAAGAGADGASVEAEAAGAGADGASVEAEAAAADVALEEASGSSLGPAVEAILFTTGRAVSSEELARACGTGTAEMRAFVRDFAAAWNSAAHGTDIIELDDSWQMCTRREFYPQLITLELHPRKPHLTDVVLETLSVIAYKQPVTKAEIERIRGVNSDHAVNKLVEFHLVQELGRAKQPGRPILFGTTREFLRVFGVSSKENLPEISPVQLADFREEAEEEAGKQGTGSQEGGGRDAENPEAGRMSAGEPENGNSSAGAPGDDGQGIGEPGIGGEPGRAGGPKNGAQGDDGEPGVGGQKTEGPGDGGEPGISGDSENGEDENIVGI